MYFKQVKHCIEYIDTLTLFVFAAEKPVEEVPKMEAPKFIVPVKDIETPVGKTVTFTCKATGVPTPEFKWFKNDKEIIPVDQQITIEVKDNGETSLVITNVQPEHDGTYSCQATNPAGSDKTKAELFVEGVLDVCKAEYGCSVDISCNYRPSYFGACYFLPLNPYCCL